MSWHPTALLHFLQLHDFFSAWFYCRASQADFCSFCWWSRHYILLVSTHDSANSCKSFILPPPSLRWILSVLKLSLAPPIPWPACLPPGVAQPSLTTSCLAPGVVLPLLRFFYEISHFSISCTRCNWGLSALEPISVIAPSTLLDSTCFSLPLLPLSI